MANTGTSGLPEMISFAGLLMGAGLLMAFTTRKRRAQQHGTG
jgi:hypothetical protein